MKALYRRAQAYIELADLDLAELDIKKALEIDPNNRYMLLCSSTGLQILTKCRSNNWCLVLVLNRDVKLEYKTLKEKMKEFNKKEAKFYGNMFAKLTKDSNVSIHFIKVCNVFILSIFHSDLDWWFIFWLLQKDAEPMSVDSKV